MIHFKHSGHLSDLMATVPEGLSELLVHKFIKDNTNALIDTRVGNYLID